jgi:two-component system, cell cycle response regulator DivK
VLAPLILLAEDFEDVREMYGTCLAFEGFQVVFASDGAEAVEAARDRRPNLVLMDMMMPRMDGLEATRAMKDDPELRSIPILMLTANTYEHHRQAARDAGCDGYLTKPCSPETLVQAVRDALQLGS